MKEQQENIVGAAADAIVEETFNIIKDSGSLQRDNDEHHISQYLLEKVRIDVEERLNGQFPLSK